jgi:hypothetical protein
MYDLRSLWHTTSSILAYSLRLQLPAPVYEQTFGSNLRAFYKEDTYLCAGLGTHLLRDTKNRTLCATFSSIKV